jgi:hypothetical protein
MPTVLDIIRATPKTNCGECGFPACMAFAAACITGQARIKQCPYIAKDLVLEGKDEEISSNTHSTCPDTALLRELQAKVKDIDLAARAEDMGAKFMTLDEGNALELDYLGKKILLAADYVRDMEGAELDPRDQILLYNYLFFKGTGPLSNEWVGLESFPNSISKVVTLKKYTEGKIASEFEGKVDVLRELCLRLGAVEVVPCHADLCMTVPVLPMVPIQIHFWDMDEEDGFPARVKALFDSRAMDFLDLESLVFSAERMAEILISLKDKD